MYDLTGKTLGPYRIIEQLGRGGMATVYKAYEPSLDRYVALKILASFYAEDEAFRSRFKREATAIAKLEHPNILPIYSFGEEMGISYIAMKYVTGGTLKDRLGKPLDPPWTARLITQIAEALDYAHKRGVIHRDAKPANVLLTEEGWPLLSDFGIAKMLESTTYATQSGALLGTPQYMSPEQGQGQKVDKRADIYALGVILFEMLTGRVPFDADTPAAVIIKHIMSPLPMPREVNPDLSEGVERVILKAVAKNPEDRFQTAGELAKALEAAMGGPTTAPVAVPEMAPPAERRELETAAMPPYPQMPSFAQTAAQPKAVAPEVAVPPVAHRFPAWIVPLAGVAILAVAALGLLASPLGASLIALVAPKATETPLPTQPPIVAKPTLLEPTAKPKPTAKLKPTAAPREPLPIGVLVPLSGEFAPLGKAVLNGVNMAVKQWNGKGGVLGRPAALVVEDDKNVPDAGLLGVKTMLTDKGVRFFVGSVTSKVSIPVSEYANAKQMIMITPISTHPRVTVDEGKRKEFVFRACYTGLISPWAMAQFAWKDLRAKRAAVLWEGGSEYSAIVADVFANVFKKLGGEITHFGDLPGDEKDFGPILEKVQSTHPDLVYLPLFPHQVNIIAAQARKMGLKAVLAGGDRWDSPDLDAGAVEGGYFTTHFSAHDDRLAVQAFVRAYREVYGTAPDMFSALGYDAADILLTAIQKANSEEPAKVRDTLAEIRGFPAVTGNISYYSDGNPVKDVVIMKISGGKPVYVRAVEGPKQR